MYDNKGNSSFPFDLSQPLTKGQAESIYDKGKEAVIFALMAATALVANSGGSPADSPETPSGMVPPYKKPPKKKSRKKPGAKVGHKGKHRKSPEVNRREEHDPLTNCPDCGSPLGEPADDLRLSYFFSFEAGGSLLFSTSVALSSTNHSTTSARSNSMACATAAGRLIYHCSLFFLLMS